MLEVFLERYVYLVVVILLGIGLYMTIASPNLVKKIIGVNLFQTAVFLLFVALAYVEGGSAPVVPASEAGGLYASPLPHVIVLTAIVVGVSVTALGLALIVRIYRQYGTVTETGVEEVRRNE